MQHSLTDVINQSTVLQKILQRAKMLNKLAAILPRIVPEISDCCIANVETGVLSLVTSSPAIKHQLRYSSNEILTKAQQLLPQYCLREVKIFVKPGCIAEQHKADLPKPHLSKDSGACIAAIMPIIKNNKLLEALQRLADSATTND